MNSCILTAEVVQEPQLRYTQDNQTPIAELWVQFPGLRTDDQPSRLKVIGWRNLAQDIQGNFREGDQVLIEGRLRMDLLDRPEGFKEKRAELTAERIHNLSSGESYGYGAGTGTTRSTTSTAPAPTFTASTTAESRPMVSEPSPSKAAASSYSSATVEAVEDDIPF